MSEEIKICSNCGCACPSEFKFCPDCGTNIEEQNCPQCGAPLMPKAKFCVNCGAKIGFNFIAEDSQTPEPETTVESEVSQEQEGRKTVKKRRSGALKKISLDNFFVKLVKDTVLVVLCVILLALSFTNILSVNLQEYIGEDFDYKANLSAVDFISVMGAVNDTKHNDDYSHDLEVAYEKLTEALQDDYDTTREKWYLTDRTKALISEYEVCYLKYTVSSDEAEGSATNVNIVLTGVLCLIDILFACAMLIVSVLSLILNLLKKQNRISKFYYAMPVFLFLTMLCLFMANAAGGPGAAVAAAMGANLFFGALALIAAFAVAFLSSENRSLKKALPKFVTVCMCVIICACMFAPFLTAKYEVKLQNKRYEDNYSVGLDADSLITFLAPDMIKDLEQSQENGYNNVYKAVMNRLSNMLNSFSQYCTEKEFESIVGETVGTMTLGYLIAAIGRYDLTAALSGGFYILILVFVLLCAAVVWTASHLFDGKRGENKFIGLVLAIIIISLACSVGLICIANYYLNDYDITACSFTVGGGAIAAILVAIVALVTSSVFERVLQKKEIAEREQALEDFEAEVRD